MNKKPCLGTIIKLTDFVYIRDLWGELPAQLFLHFVLKYDMRNGGKQIKHSVLGISQPDTQLNDYKGTYCPKT